jgi:predicted nucleotidyltransferase
MNSVDPRIISAFPDGFSLDLHTVCLAMVGSTSHNTYVPHDDPNSIDDVDYMGIAIPPVNKVIGLSAWDHWTMQKEELDVVYYSFSKLFGLLLKSNPNVVGLLWLEPSCYVYLSPIFKRLIENREIFSSKRAYKAFSGYAYGQIYKMEHGKFEGYMGAKRKSLVEKFGYDCKNGAHAIRLLRMGTEFLETGVLRVYRTDDAEEIREIKSGKWTLDEVKAEAWKLLFKAKTALDGSSLPDEPDCKAAEELLISSTLDFWNKNELRVGPLRWPEIARANP